MEKIEVFELVIDTDDESGVTAIALVDQPAIESNWMAFSQQTEYKFNIKDEEKRIIEGYFMVADLLIGRINPDTGAKFFVKFSGKTIEAIREKQSRLGLNNNFNLMHDPRQIAEGVYMLDKLIVDNERGKVAPKEFEKVPNGSLWGSAKVDNDEIWEQVKNGTFKGFSVEGMFKQLEPVEMDENLINKIRETIQDFEKSMYDNVQVTNKQTIDNMSKETLDKVKSLIFGEETKEVEAEATPEVVTEIKLAAIELANGTMINVDPALEVGAVVTVEVDGAVAPMPNGEYPLADGTIVTVSEGAISDIKEVEAEEAEEMETEATPVAETVTEAKIRKIIESTETVFAKVETLETELETVKAEFAKYKEESDTKEKALFSAVEELATESSVAPIKKKRSGVISPKKKSIFTVNK
jgi:hypothetical protein